MQAQNPFTVCSIRVYLCLYLCWYVCVCVSVCACKLKGNFSRKNTFSLLRFYGCLDLFLVRRWLLFHCPGEYHTTKECCCCCCCCCGFSVFHVMQLIKKLFAPCCPYKKQKREAQKERDSKSSSVTYGITHFRFRPVHASVHPSARLTLALALAVTEHLTPRHHVTPSPLHPLRATLRQGFCNFLCWRSEQIKKSPKNQKVFIVLCALRRSSSLLVFFSCWFTFCLCFLLILHAQNFCDL